MLQRNDHEHEQEHEQEHEHEPSQRYGLAGEQEHE